MRSLHKIVFLVEEFHVPSPAQQLLDRFLIGYPRDGTFRRFQGLDVSICLGEATKSNLGSRVADFGLKVMSNSDESFQTADAVVVIPGGTNLADLDSSVRHALEHAPEGTTCFVHGVLGGSLESAQKHLKLAQQRNIAVTAGTSTGVTWRLPQWELPEKTALTEALIVVQGKPLVAELNALEGLLPVIERRKAGEQGIHNVQFLEGKDVWRAGDKRQWSWELLAAAISRSDALQGETAKDGRTQDIVGLGLLPSLATQPRAWLLEHGDGLRSAILVLDGALSDFNFALKARGGATYSAQLYRPAPPWEHHFSALASVVEDFFRSEKLPWPVERNLLVVGLLETFSKALNHPGQRVLTPQLKSRYRVPPP